MSPADELAAGTKAHPGIVKQFGGAYRENGVASRVMVITGRLAAGSANPDAGYRVTVLDSPTINAFAAPGGYLYVTRGLLALANDEAELASVLAHEMGHVTARHSAKRHTEAVKAKIVSGVLGALGGNRIASSAIEKGAAGYVARYSRDQEFAADEIGIKTTARAGYDAQAAPKLLANMGRQFELEAKIINRDHDTNQANFLASHPATPERVALARRHARNAASVFGARRNRDAYLDMIDGLLYGHNPRDGIIRGRVFSHPHARFEFTVPKGFVIENRRDAIVARGPRGSAMLFDGVETPEGVELEDFVSQLWARGLVLKDTRRFKVDGLAAVSAAVRHRGIDHRLVAIRVAPDQVYRFLMVTKPENTAAHAPAMARAARTFRRLSEAEARKLKPLRIRVVTVRRGDTVGSLARRMLVASHKKEQFRVLNGLAAGAPLTPGQRVKIISQ